MENKSLLNFLKLDSLVEHLSGYVEDKLELFKIEAKEELSVVISKAIVILLIIVFASFFVLFASITLALYLNAILETTLGGFGLVALLHLIILIGIITFKNNKRLNSFVEKNMTDSSEEN